jgi:hypothetical protein
VGDQPSHGRDRPQRERGRQSRWQLEALPAVEDVCECPIRGPSHGKVERLARSPRSHRPWYESYAAATLATRLAFAQCQLHSQYQKYTDLSITEGWQHGRVRPALAVFDRRPCRCKGKHGAVAAGRTERGGYDNSAAAARYPDEMNMGFARALVELARVRAVESVSAAELAARAERLKPFWARLDSCETLDACDPVRCGALPRDGYVQPTLRGMLPGAAAPAAAESFANAAAAALAAAPAAAAAPAVLECEAAAARAGEKRVRSQLNIPDDAPEDVAMLMCVHGISKAKIPELAAEGGDQFGPRCGVSDARRLLRAIDRGLQGGTALERYAPLWSGLSDEL